MAEQLGQLILSRRPTCLVPFPRFLPRTVMVLLGCRVLATQWKLSAEISLLGLTLFSSSYNGPFVCPVPTLYNVESIVLTVTRLMFPLGLS